MKTRLKSILLALVLTHSGVLLAETPVTANNLNSIMASESESGITSKLLGRWEIVDPTTKITITLIFASDEDLFLIIPDSKGETVAIKMKYKINPKTQPMELDLEVSPNEIALTIFELTSLGKLRLQLDKISPGQTRPTQLSDTASSLSKVSEEIKLPDNIKVVQLETPPDERLAIPIKYLSILISAQKDYFQTNGKFADSMEKLGFAGNLETEFYRYQINNSKDHILMITAKAKEEGLPGFTAAIFSQRIRDKVNTIAGICQTDKPSIEPPNIPDIAPDQSEIKCSPGSSLIKPK